MCACSSQKTAVHGLIWRHLASLCSSVAIAKCSAAPSRNGHNAVVMYHVHGRFHTTLPPLRTFNFFACRGVTSVLEVLQPWVAPNSKTCRVTHGRLCMAGSEETGGWRLPFLLIAAPTILLAVIMVLTTVEPPRGVTEDALKATYAQVEGFAYKVNSFLGQAHMVASSSHCQSDCRIPT